ncbi:MAG: hypothetical protein ACRCX2_27360 [Paraclostridium sp.]
MQISEELHNFLLKKLYEEIKNLEARENTLLEIKNLSCDKIEILEKLNSRTSKALENTNIINSKLLSEIEGLKNTKLYHIVEIQNRNKDINDIHEANQKLIKENLILKNRIAELETSKSKRVKANATSR